MTDRPRPDRIRLVLADVDGTLVTTEKVLTERAKAAVRKLADKGIAFAITSGRPPKGMRMVIDPLAITTPVAGFNGGLFVKPDLTIIEAKTLARADAEKTAALIRDLGLDVWVYSGEDWLLHDDKAPHVDREAHTVQFGPKVVRDFGDALDHAVKIVGVSDDLELVKRAEAEAQRALGEHASAARSQPYYLDVTHRDANKGGVCQYLSRTMGIPEAEIATLGDQPNDVLMFRRSGLSIAMGNAGAEVQGAADRVSTGCDEEGFANAIERFVLGGE